MSGLGEHDFATLAEGLARPDQDPRTWFSHGTVEQDTSDAHSVRFNDDSGNPLPHGVLIDVKLHPSGIKLPCRALMHTAGAGEGEYTPFGPGDEVYVSIPDGDFKNGGIIIGRGSNSLDVFPTTVAGVDVTQNNVAFKRVKVPYIFETGGSYLVRSALTGAQLSFDATGNVLLSDGSGNLLALNNSVLQLAESTNATLIQIDPSKLELDLIANGTSLSMNKDGASFLTQGTFTLGTSGAAATGHAVTLEQVLILLAALLPLLPFTAPIIPPAQYPIITGAMTAALALPITPLTTAIIAALQTPVDTSGTLPGLGKPGLLF